MTFLNVGKCRIICFIHTAGGALYYLCNMTAQKHTGRYIYQLVVDFLLADNNHFSTAFVTDFGFDLMEDLFHRKICVNLVPGALDTIVGLYLGCLLCLRIDIRHLFRLIKQRKLFCILQNDFSLLALLSVELLFKPGDTLFQNSVFVLQRR